MKAITCSQCGALIKQIRKRDKFAQCEYCHAAIPILKDKIFEISEKKAKEQERLRQKIKAMRKVEHDEWRENLSKDHERDNKRMITWTIAFIIICLLPFLLYYIFNK